MFPAITKSLDELERSVAACSQTMKALHCSQNLLLKNESDLAAPNATRDALLQSGRSIGEATWLNSALSNRSSTGMLPCGTCALFFYSIRSYREYSLIMKSSVQYGPDLCSTLVQIHPYCRHWKLCLQRA